LGNTELSRNSRWRDPSFRGLKIKDDDFFSLSQWILGVFADQGAIDWNVRFALENGHPIKHCGRS
jgi:hypothetical protein